MAYFINEYDMWFYFQNKIIQARSVFSKYEVYPSTDINFGPMLLNSKKSRSFTIVNKGEFDFKVITKS